MAGPPPLRRDDWHLHLHRGVHCMIVLYLSCGRLMVTKVVINHGYLFLESPVGNARFSFRQVRILLPRTFCTLIVSTAALRTLQQHRQSVSGCKPPVLQLVLQDLHRGNDR